MDVISLPIELSDNKIDSRYRLCAIASQRAKELSMGAQPRVQTKARKVTSVAIEELIAGTLEFLTGEEARQANEEAKKFDYRKLLEESRKAAATEELTELEKDLRVYLNGKESVDKKSFEELFTQKSGEDTAEE